MNIITTNIVIWVLAGGIIAWLYCVVLQRNAAQSTFTSIAVGIFGATLGGQVLAPIFGATMANPADFSVFALFVACASAAGCLTVSNFVHRP